MNLAKLKAYAPKARQEFLQAVTDRAAYYGIKQEGAEVSFFPVAEKGDGVVIGGRAFPRKVGEQRKALEGRIREHGFAQTMEALAYTWFNRLVAIRFMETHGYLDHGYRVLSPAPHLGDGGSERLPELLEQAEHVSLPGLSQQTVIDLKIDGTKDAQLYRLLVIAQCNALHSTMPFIFPKIDDETELLLPDNLLHSDSLIRNLAREISDEDCASVEILGWLYQFYITEKKADVMARKGAVPTEDIPSVTQLFTPHWIVRYLVENSLGRLWLLNRPDSRLREHMPYYIDGEAETEFLKIAKPEDIRVLDPAVGSGHMLTYAFDLLYAIYVEEGYAPADVPALILEHNLHGLDICPRAAQLAALALVLKAREKSRRFFQSDRLVQPQLAALQDVHFEDAELREYMRALNLGDLFDVSVLKLLRQFEHATTFGSLICPCVDHGTIALIRSAIEAKDLGGQLFLRSTHVKVLRVLTQADALCQRYHVAVTNPPYMGSGQMNARLKSFAKDEHPDARSDAFAMFLERGFRLVVPGGTIAMLTMHAWMFLGSYEALRRKLLEFAVCGCLHIGYNTFPELNSKIAQGAAIVLVNSKATNRAGVYIGLNDAPQSADKEDVFFQKKATGAVRLVVSDVFKRLPGHPIAYWLSSAARHAFSTMEKLDGRCRIGKGLDTGCNEKFLRLWHEVSRTSARWTPCQKGGPFRKWYGNHTYVIDWEDDGKRLRAFPGANLRNEDSYFKAGISWTRVSSSAPAFRLFPKGFAIESTGPCVFPVELPAHNVLAFLNSTVASFFLKVLSPTLDFQSGHVSALPALPGLLADPALGDGAKQLVALAHGDWDNFETSWDFTDLPLLRPGTKRGTLADSWEAWRDESASATLLMEKLETENNRLCIAAYGLVDELAPSVDRSHITLTCNPAFRFKKKRNSKATADEDDRAEAEDEDISYSDEEQQVLFANQTVKELLSYAVGCMMGRYSLDKPGLILANAGDTLAEYHSKVGRSLDSLSFAPDEDGIIPVPDGEWFEDDVVARTREFLRATFGESTLEANLRFIEDALGKDLRKYFLSDFFKDHRQTYKKRPIYWLFSSGKQRAFQCLVYMHRYNEGTLSRMRTEYVVPLQGQIASRVEQLEGDKAKATSTSHRKKLQKEQDLLKKQQTELLTFDEKLKHAAGQKISLNLDDGVKVNYGKFGDLLADVDAVTGGADE